MAFLNVVFLALANPDASSTRSKINSPQLPCDLDRALQCQRQIFASSLSVLFRSSNCVTCWESEERCLPSVSSGSNLALKLLQLDLERIDKTDQAGLILLGEPLTLLLEECHWPNS